MSTISISPNRPRPVIAAPLHPHSVGLTPGMEFHITADSRCCELITDVKGPYPGVPVRLAIACEHPVARLAIEMTLERAGGFAIVGTAADVHELVNLAVVERPDVVVLDWMMPGGGGPEAARRILYWSPDTLILALTSSGS